MHAPVAERTQANPWSISTRYELQTRFGAYAPLKGTTLQTDDVGDRNDAIQLFAKQAEGNTFTAYSPAGVNPGEGFGVAVLRGDQLSVYVQGTSVEERRPSTAPAMFLQLLGKVAATRPDLQQVRMTVDPSSSLAGTIRSALHGAHSGTPGNLTLRLDALRR